MSESYQAFQAAQLRNMRLSKLSTMNSVNNLPAFDRSTTVDDAEITAQGSTMVSSDASPYVPPDDRRTTAADMGPAPTRECQPQEDISTSLPPVRQCPTMWTCCHCKTGNLINTVTKCTNPNSTGGTCGHVKCSSCTTYQTNNGVAHWIDDDDDDFSLMPIDMVMAESIRGTST